MDRGYSVAGHPQTGNGPLDIGYRRGRHTAQTHPSVQWWELGTLQGDIQLYMGVGGRCIDYTLLVMHNLCKSTT